MMLQVFFGGLVFLASAALFLWERHVFLEHREADPWLFTPRRFRRRLTVCVILALIGIGLTFEALGYVPTNRLGILLVFSTVMLLGTCMLLILALQDLRDTTNNAKAELLRKSLLSDENTLNIPEPTDRKISQLDNSQE